MAFKSIGFDRVMTWSFLWQFWRVLLPDLMENGRLESADSLSDSNSCGEGLWAVHAGLGCKRWSVSVKPCQVELRLGFAAGVVVHQGAGWIDVYFDDV